MYIGICEDELIQIEYLNREIKNYYRQKKIKITIENFQSAEELLFKYPEDLPFDCLILDIKMKQQIYISVSNATNEHVKKSEKEFITKKKGNHGHGIKRINLIVEKYQGFINRQNEPGVFATEIMLPMKESVHS